MEILEKSDEWTVEDQIITKQILKGRGLEISDEQLKANKAERLSLLRKGKEAKAINLLFSFLAIIFGFFIHIVFAIGGIGMALYYAYDKSTDEEGNRYYTFEPKTRQYGEIIFYCGLLILAFEIIALYGWFFS
jgi:hypothetical protein